MSQWSWRNMLYAQYLCPSMQRCLLVTFGIVLHKLLTSDIHSTWGCASQSPWEAQSRIAATTDILSMTVQHHKISGRGWLWSHMHSHWWTFTWVLTRTLWHFYVQRYSITKMIHTLVKNKLSQALVYLSGYSVQCGKATYCTLVLDDSHLDEMSPHLKTCNCGDK